ncbi:MAG: Hsp20 family protein [Chitinivibrionales bacterium]|nr:Hsp20 family protein [Chitinivibrionales bacterium]MBD3355731.1 Hsp20 family protein [Chitinivibrionales bacterium]
MLWDVDMWRDLERLRSEMNRLFANGGASNGGTNYPLVNVYDDAENLTVTAELPGMTKDRVNITFSDGTLTIAGKRERNEKVRNMAPVRQERAVGSFEKTLRIPTKVKQEAIAASFSNGVLTITMPKAEEAKPKTIAIEA